MPRGFYSYVGLQEEIGTLGVPELNAWGGQKGTKWDSYCYFDSETMTEANDLRFLNEIGYSGTMDRAIKKHRIYGKRCEGGFTFSCYPEGAPNKEFLGLLLKHAMCHVTSGTYSGGTTAAGGFGTALHTIIGADDWMERLWNIGTGTGCYGLTVNVGREDTAGTIRNYPFIGCRVRALEFVCTAGEELKCTVEFTGRLAKDDAATLTPAYPTMVPFLFKDARFEICTQEDGSGGTEQTIDAFRVRIDNGLTDIFVLGTQTLGRVTCGSQRMVTGSFTAPYKTWVRDEQQKWKEGTASGIKFYIDTGIYRIEFRMPNIYYTGNPPSISDVGENVVELPFQATLKTTFDLKVLLVNTDDCIGSFRS